MNEKTEKEQTVDYLIMMTVCSSSDPRKPGEIIKRLSNEKREIVKTLKSEDFNRRIK